METIKLGYAGKDLPRLLECLQRAGHSLPQVTTCNDAVRKAVIDFQQKHQLDADGIVGYRTWESLVFSGIPAAERLTDDDFNRASLLLDCEPAALKAVQQVETGGRGGFLSPGKPHILFEGHVFWKELKNRGIDPNKYVASNPDILYPSWTKKYYKGGQGEYDRLERARRINADAANASASWGMFQIMGNNYAACGESSVASFVAAMCASERNQLLLSARFIYRNKTMLSVLQDRNAEKNWAQFARAYNGPGYKENQYDVKLDKAYRSFLK